VLNRRLKKSFHVQGFDVNPSRIAGVSPFFFSMKLCWIENISSLCSMQVFFFAKLLAFLVKHEILSLSFEQNPSICVMLI